jgi:hypothetical protein
MVLHSLSDGSQFGRDSFASCCIIDGQLTPLRDWLTPA